MKNVLFDDFDISQDVKEAIREMGFITPTPIQAEAIPVCLSGRDIIGQAQTGTGKTAAFAIPTIELIDESNRAVQVLVLCPTRELALQVANEFKKLVKFKKNVKIAAVYGGASIERQIDEIRRGAQIVVGTPGRVQDHIDRGTLKLDKLQALVLDEADEMLNMGFVDDIRNILETAPEERQTILFSATMPKPILQITKEFQKDPVLVKITQTELTTRTIEQLYVEMRPEGRLVTMLRLAEIYKLKHILIFSNTKTGVDDLVHALQALGELAEGLHGDMRQQARNQTLNKFKAGHIRMLVATDVAARGIDIDIIDGVFNYDVPLDIENYVHRIGRTGRAGRSGVSIMFVCSRKDQDRYRSIEKHTKAPMAKIEIPTAEQVNALKTDRVAQEILNRINSDELADSLALAEKLLQEGVPPKLLLASALYPTVEKLQVWKELPEPQKLDGKRDRSIEREGGRERESSFRDRGGRERSGERTRSTDKGERGGRSGQVRLFLNIGRNQKIRPGDIVGAIAGETGVPGGRIGEIEIKDKHSYVFVDRRDAEIILATMSGNSIKGFRVNMEMSR